MAGVDSQWPNEHTEGVALPRSKKLNPKPFKERSQENDTLRKTNTKIAAPSLKSVWCIVSKLCAEGTYLSILQSFIWRRHVGVPWLASTQRNS